MVMPVERVGLSRGGSGLISLSQLPKKSSKFPCLRSSESPIKRTKNPNSSSSCILQGSNDSGGSDIEAKGTFGLDDIERMTLG